MSPKIVAVGIDDYIAQCPETVRERLNEMWRAIREAAPDSLETLSYFRMPGFYYEGFDYNGMFAWFSYKKPYVRLHVRPPVLEEHKDELAPYPTTAAIASFPEAEALPSALVKRLVKASVAIMKAAK